MDLLKDVSRLREVDILVLAEMAIPIGDVVSELNQDADQLYFAAEEPLPESTGRQVHILTHLQEDRVRPLQDGAGFSAKQILPIVGPDFTIIAVHLQSKLFREEIDQTIAALRINESVRTIENEVGHHRTLLIGDFNMNPFEPGLVSAECFHAVMSRRIAQRRSRVVDSRNRPFFYNPMWNHFGDHPPSPPGSYYRSGSGQSEYFWHLVDQVLIRPDLLQYFADERLEVLTEIGHRSLVTENGIPNREVGSDHLPLLLELSIEQGGVHGRTEPVGEVEGERAEDSDTEPGS